MPAGSRPPTESNNVGVSPFQLPKYPRYARSRSVTPSGTAAVPGSGPVYNISHSNANPPLPTYDAPVVAARPRSVYGQMNVAAVPQHLSSAIIPQGQVPPPSNGESAPGARQRQPQAQTMAMDRGTASQAAQVQRSITGGRPGVYGSGPSSISSRPQDPHQPLEPMSMAGSSASISASSVRGFDGAGYQAAPQPQSVSQGRRAPQALNPSTYSAPHSQPQKLSASIGTGSFPRIGSAPPAPSPLSVRYLKERERERDQGTAKPHTSRGGDVYPPHPTTSALYARRGGAEGGVVPVSSVVGRTEERGGEGEREKKARKERERQEMERIVALDRERERERERERQRMAHGRERGRESVNYDREVETDRDIHTERAFRQSASLSLYPNGARKERESVTRHQVQADVFRETERGGEIEDLSSRAGYVSMSVERGQRQPSVERQRERERESMRIRSLKDTVAALQTDLKQAEMRLDTERDSLALSTTEQVSEYSQMSAELQQRLQAELVRMREEHSHKMARLEREHKDWLREREREEKEKQELESQRDRSSPSLGPGHPGSGSVPSRADAQHRDEVSVLAALLAVEQGSARRGVHDTRVEREREVQALHTQYSLGSDVSADATQTAQEERERLVRTAAVLQAERDRTEAQVHTAEARLRQLCPTPDMREGAYRCVMRDRLLSLSKQLETQRERRKQLHLLVEDMKGNIRVIVRQRPMLQNERRPTQAVGVQSVEDIRLGEETVTLVGNAGDEKALSFYKVLGPQARQSHVYNYVEGVIRSVLDGYNVCLLCYGQTGSGKTYTILGEEDSLRRGMGGESEAESSISGLGIVPRALRHIYQHVALAVTPCALSPTRDGERGMGGQVRRERERERGTRTGGVRIELAIVELYCNHLIDLTDDTKGGRERDLKIRQTPDGGTYVEGLTWVHCPTYTQCVAQVEKGLAKRHIASTRANSVSSRSHTIIYLSVKRVQVKNGVERETTALCTFVDLAGSERISRSRSSGQRLQEAQFINSSLSALGDCIHALSRQGISSQKGSRVDRSVSDRTDRPKEFIPFRNSRLTMLLKPCLHNNSKTVLFACLSPHRECMSETTSTLGFASRVRLVRNVPIPNANENLFGQND
ncbi:kinesin-like protein [Kipferlia bialata]|uniref:Kinesin-like protein n=1 Tax=Kipferlia bialata TaxID=797122 RepID=A0A9K3CLK1_9EUKA|nr:kinesin-like protein [Kipferlia bialata]|eukprot:g105.t1